MRFHVPTCVTPEEAHGRRVRLAGATALALLGAWLVLLAYAVHPALPPNAVQLPAAEHVQARLWLPQGWAFFTRNPREDDVFLFRRSGAAWRSVALGPASRPAYMLGLRRLPRARNIELGLVIACVPPSAWKRCSVRPQECAATIGETTVAKNPTPHASLCGVLAIVRQPPVPWAWGRSDVVMPSTAAGVDVKC